MIQIGLDTSVIIGLLDPGDVWHAQAKALYQSLMNRQVNAVVADCVLAEALSTLTRRIYEKRRGSDLDDLIRRLLSVPVLYDDIVSLVRSSRGELNFNDALIALAYQGYGINFIASFDHDFDRIPWLQRLAQPNDLSADVE